MEAMQITDKIVNNPGSSWKELFEPVDFFSMYRTYVQVVAAAGTSEGIKDWSGMVESRIRTLVQDLEMTDNVLLAHPQAHSISNEFICLTDEEQAAASQGELSVEAMQRKEEDFAGQDYKKVYTKNFFIGLDIERKPSTWLRPLVRRLLTASVQRTARVAACSTSSTQVSGSARAARVGTSTTSRR